jgi:HEAT repeat protein
VHELRFLLDEYQKRASSPLRRFLLRRIESRRSPSERAEGLGFIEEELQRPVQPQAGLLNLSRLLLTEVMLRSRFGGDELRGGWSVILSAGGHGASDVSGVFERDPGKVQTLQSRAEEILQPALEALLGQLDKDLKFSDQALYTLACLPSEKQAALFKQQFNSQFAVPCTYALMRRDPSGETLDWLLANITGLEASPLGPDLIRQLAWVPKPQTLRTLDHLSKSSHVEVLRATAFALEGFSALPFRPVAERLAASSDPFVQLHLAESLGQIGSPDAHPLLMQLFQGASNDFIRYHCVRAAAAIGTPSALPLFAAGLRSSSETVKSIALEGLVTNQLQADATPKIIERCLTSSSPDLLLTAHFSLLMQDREKGFAAFMNLLRQSDEMAQQVALYGLRHMKGEQLSKIVSAFTVPGTDPALFSLALEVLARQRGDGRALNVVFPLLSAPEETIRAQAVRTAARIAKSTEHALDTAIRMSELLAKEPAPAVRQELVKQLAELGRGTQGEIGRILSETAMNDPDPGVKRNAILGTEILGELPDQLMDVVRVNIHPEVQAAMVRTLWCHGNPEAVRILQLLLEEGGRKKREAAFQVLQVIGMELALLPFCPGLNRLARRLRPPGIQRPDGRTTGKSRAIQQAGVAEGVVTAGEAAHGPAMQSLEALLEKNPTGLKKDVPVPADIVPVPTRKSKKVNVRMTGRLGPALMTLKGAEAPPPRSKKLALVISALVLILLGIGWFLFAAPDGEPVAPVHPRRGGPAARPSPQ